MEEGSFYCYVPSGPQVPSWLPFGKASEKSVLKRLGSLHDRPEPFPGISSSIHARGSSFSKRSLSSGECEREGHLTLPGAGVTAVPGWVEVAGELYRVQPVVHHIKDAFIVMYGYLFDADALQPSCWSTPDGARNMRGSWDGVIHSPFEEHEYVTSGGGVECGARVAQLLLQHVLRVTRSDGSLADALQDVKGRYSFVIYDSDKRCVYASRDPYGEESLYYFLDAEGAAHFSNVPLDVPDYPNTASKWVKVPVECCLRIKPGKPHKQPKVETTPLPGMKADSRLLLPVTIDDSANRMTRRLSSSPTVPIRLSNEFSSGSDTAEDQDDTAVEETIFPLDGLQAF
eukprot:jgi/Tetstr1/429344/TSEL_019262.t1